MTNKIKIVEADNLEKLEEEINDFCSKKNFFFQIVKVKVNHYDAIIQVGRNDWQKVGNMFYAIIQYINKGDLYNDK